MRNALRTGLGLLLMTMACGGGGGPDPAVDGGPARPDGATAGPDAGPGGLEDLDMQAADFECVLRWDRVRAFRITNKLGYLQQTLAVAGNAAGGVYPVGTIIQLVPQEAMVKRRKGWSPATNDWEFFFLGTSATGTEILTRGKADIVNRFGGNCADCHSLADARFDFVCEQDHGCEPLQIGRDVIESVQNADPRPR
jgi:hypothetical protein